MTRAVCCCAAALLLLSACSKDDGVTVLKLGHGLDINHPVHHAMEYMAERFEEKSGGTARIEIFPSEQLGSEREMNELVQLGQLDMTKTSTAALESFVPAMAVFGVPYIFRDADHFWKVLLGPTGKRISEAGTSVGLRGLCYYDSGSRSFYTIDRPIKHPDDLKGMKIRVQESKTALALVENLGATPTPISWGELYTSLQQGLVDGAENNAPSLYTSRHYEVCKHYSLDAHTRVPDFLMISEAVWQGLEPQMQQWLQEAADESSTYQRKLWEEKTQEALDAVREAGVTIYTPDLTPFQEKVAPMLAAYEGTEIGDLIEAIAAVE